MKKRFIGFLFIVIAVIALILVIWATIRIISQPKKPDVNSILNHKTISQALVNAKEINGIASYSDVDALLFTYKTDLKRDKFFASLKENLKLQNWNLISSKDDTWSFKNSDFKYGELRVKKKKDIVIVAYWTSTTNQSSRNLQNITYGRR